VSSRYQDSTFLGGSITASTTYPLLQVKSSRNRGQPFCTFPCVHRLSPDLRTILAQPLSTLLGDALKLLPLTLVWVERTSTLPEWAIP